MIGTIGVKTIDGAIHELVQRVAGNELEWDRLVQRGTVKGRVSTAED